MLQVMGQGQDHILGHIGEVLDLFGQNRAHPHRRIARQMFKRLDGKIDDMRAFPFLQAGHQARDFSGELDAHIFVVIFGEITVDGSRRGQIGGDGGAGGGRAMLGQIFQDAVAGIGALGELGLGFARARLQDVQRIARVETLLLAQIPMGDGFFHASSSTFANGSVGPGVLKAVKQAWFPGVNKLAPAGL